MADHCKAACAGAALLMLQSFPSTPMLQNNFAMHEKTLTGALVLQPACVQGLAHSCTDRDCQQQSGVFCYPTRAEAGRLRRGVKNALGLLPVAKWFPAAHPAQKLGDSDELWNALDGIFACVLLDESTGDFVAARDPIGVCSFYWGRGADGSVWFASEMKALQAYCATFDIFPPVRGGASCLLRRPGGFTCRHE